MKTTAVSRNTWLHMLAWLLVLAACFIALPAHAAGTTEFDHLRTGYALTGAHKDAKCESCHIGGVFKGTPRDCESCHVSGARFARLNVVKPADHLPSQQTCNTCHTTRTFNGAKMNHTGVATGSCQTCHNGVQASGKPAGHLATSATCDTCHRTTAWKPASGFNHVGVSPGSCASCHDGQKATGKPATHTPYQSVAGISQASCDSCHKAGFAAWTPAKLHTSVTVSGQCATCHAAAKPNTAIHSGQTVCETCHKSTTAWTGAKVDHSIFNASTNCASCHNGSAATGKSATHIPSGSTNCLTCHATSGWKPSSWNHTQLTVSNQCATCHTGAFPPADGKSATHTPYQSVSGLSSANCDTCHKAGYVSWTPAKLHTSVSIVAQCATCHAAIKPGTAIHTGQTVCENCHKSTTTWSAGKVDHGLFNASTNCASCHNGSAATGKSATHIPVGATNCITCHSTSGWKPTSWNHTQLTVSNQCATCHTGAFPPADGKSATHTPYQSVAGLGSANCDTCHKAGYTSWTPAKLHTSVSIVAQCATCHAAIKPATAIHTGQTVCENCHKSTTTWSAGKVDHSLFNAATNCATCHNGSAATGKSATHIPVAATNCITCHSTSGWKPTSWNHTQLVVSNQCATCHTGAFPPADGKPSNHTPYQSVAGLGSANCDTCHKAGYTSWTPAKLHTNVSVVAQCATCHASVKPATAIHTGQTVCETCHKSTSTWSSAKVDHSTFTVATNCATCHNGSAATGKSATHIPVGATNCISCHSTSGWKPTSWNHTQLVVTNQCATCHTGAFPPADGKSATHTPYQSVAGLGAANCDTCHKAGYTSWTPAKLHTNVSVVAQCATCHASVKPATAIHTGQTVCETCHKSTSTWSSAKVDHSTFTVATNCSTCHNGSAATGKSATHIPVGATNCIACHATTGWKPTKWNHTQVIVTGQCATCHSGAFPPADGKSASHIPYQAVAVLAASNCDTCHKAGYAAWTPARVHTSVSISSQCATCHAAIKPNTTVHVGQTVCENCHKSTSQWTGAKVDHSTFTVATNCSSCHNGSTATGKSATHIPVAATNCISCHATTAWKPTKWNHTQVSVVDCASCHSGAFPPADGKPAAHIPYLTIAGLSTANCSTCHKSGYASWANGKLHTSVAVSGQCKTCHSGAYTSQGATAKPTNHIPEAQLLNGAAMECNSCHTSTASWAQRMNHNGSQGSGAGWCKSCHATGISYLGSMKRMSLTHRTTTPVPTDCSTSGCHRPLGNKGSAYTEWD
ncbi:cytochrome c3 family protein [Caenimonas koreensis]|uniref:cytochrome c3 family protein n=1 Tax=Caenimonas koreensis TaxID=367474 RepID=UPI003785093C